MSYFCGMCGRGLKVSHSCRMGGGGLRCPTFVEWVEGVQDVLLLWNVRRESKVSYFCGLGGRGLRCPIFLEWVERTYGVLFLRNGWRGLRCPTL